LLLERYFSKLKQFPAVATRYDKRERIYQGTIDVASISIWLRDPVPRSTGHALVQYAGRILRPYHGKASAEIHDYHDYHDYLTGVFAASLAKRAPGYTSLGFPDSRRIALTPSTSLA
jgi:hypothetical protein